MTIAGITADACTINASEEIVGDFTMGVPSVRGETLPTITLVNDDGIMKNVVKNPTTGGVDVDGNTIIVGITNPLSIGGQTSGLVCSFNGGCAFEVQAQGLASRIKAEKSQIEVCGKVCTLREDLSDSSTAACEVPAI